MRQEADVGFDVIGTNALHGSDGGGGKMRINARLGARFCGLCFFRIFLGRTSFYRESDYHEQPRSQDKLASQHVILKNRVGKMPPIVMEVRRRRARGLSGLRKESKAGWPAPEGAAGRS